MVLGVVLLLGVGLALLVQQLLLRIYAKLRADPRTDSVKKREIPGISWGKTAAETHFLLHFFV